MTLRAFRTGRTQLTDDELILLDALFDGGSSTRLLCSWGFLEQWNLGVTHQFSDEQLDAVLLQLCDAGILAVGEDADGAALWRMTPDGGALWSEERCPAWDRYCTERYSDAPQGRQMMTVLAVTAETRDAFLKACAPGARTRIATIHDEPLIAWRPFDTVHVGLAIDESDPFRWADRWSRVEQRAWWRCVPELQKFVRA